MTGQRVGSYEIVRVLARGGMAIVYLARQPALHREVALKRVDLDSRDPTIAQRFVREAQLAGALAHPNIVTLYDFLESDGVPYIAMEYVSGGSLRPYIGTLTRAQVYGVLDGILAGLAHAEGHGVAHRDLKPENVLVTPRGTVKLADFGIARAYNALSQRLTGTGVAVGTPTYMSPEQAMNQPVTSATDLYAVGVMAYELLAGRPPFEGGDTPLAVLYAHVNEPAPPLRELATDTPPELCEWVEWLLAKAPADRPESADRASEELERLAVVELGPFWRRQSAIHAPREGARAATAESDDGWETYTPDTPVATVPPAVAEPTPPPVSEPTPPAHEPTPPQAPDPTPPPVSEPTPPAAREPTPPPAAREPTPPPAAAPTPPPPPSEPTPPPAAAPTPPPAVPHWEEAETRQATPAPVAAAAAPPAARRRRRGALVATAALAAVAAVAAAIVLTRGGGGDNGRGGGTDPRQSATLPYDFAGSGRQEPVIGTPEAAPGGVFVVGDEPLPITPSDAGLDVTGDGRFGTSVASGDFDGDDRADLAIGARDAGAVAILRGTPQGLATGDPQRISGRAPRFGVQLSAGDLDGDGRDDLVIGSPGDGVAAGRMEIRFGGPDGLGGRRAVLDPPDGAAPGFGTRIRIADTTGDGDLDIVESGSAGPDDPGHLTLCKGSPQGPRSCSLVTDAGGTSLAAGDVDGDGRADAVEGDSAAAPAGAVRVYRGTARGLDPEPITFDEDTPGINGDAEPGDAFGGTVAVERLDGDRYGDIAVAAPGEDGTGAFTVVRGGPDGIARRGHRRYPNPQAGDGSVFAKALTELDLDGDGQRELVVAAARPGGVLLYPYTPAGDRLQRRAPLELDADTGGEPESVSLRVGRDGDG